MTGGGDLNERFGFDAPDGAPNAFGEVDASWAEQFTRAVKLSYFKGGEAVEAARQAGRNVFKVRLRACALTRTITTDWRARDLRRGPMGGIGDDPLPGHRYNITEVDPVTSSALIYLVVEGPTS